MPVVIKNLCKSFGDKKVLNNLNLTLEDGKIYCLMGPSGMGKTTLLRILLNLETKDSGEITGIDPETEISSMFQEDRILPMLSAIDNVNMMYEKRHSVREIKEDLASILPVKCLRQPVRELSGGMKRRVSLARAVHYPGKLIILDEPFTGLDHATKEEVISYILKNRGNRILLVATHGLDDASLLGAEVIHLEECQEWPSDQKNAGPFSETSVFKQDAPIQKKESASVLGFCPGSNERKILDGIPKKDWENLDEILGGYVKEYEEGAVIWNMGDCEKDLAIVLEGEATAYIGNMRQNDSLIARFEPGRCFGEMLPLSQVPSPV